MNTIVQNPTASPGAKWSLGLTGLALLGIVALFWPTVASIMAIWERSETFAHGYLIFPITAYLIWQRRKELLAMPYQPDWRAVVLIAIMGFGWLLAHAGSVQVVEQYALIGMMLLVVWALLGWAVVWAFFFPLAFLLFAVPFGEFLIPPLMEFTADFTVAALQMTGIPVFREGLFFTIPSGQWSVVEGCSGLRYLIASFTLGTLYAYLTYRSLKRRVIFSLLAIVVPILANGFRAYMIVMIGHLSDMKLAMGVDHFIYGWVWFGIVMLLMFWIGAYWREDDQRHGSQDSTPMQPGVDRGAVFKMLALVVAVLLPWPIYAHFLEERAAQRQVVVIPSPTPMQGWVAVPTPMTDWKPQYQGASGESVAYYMRAGQTVGVYLAYYRTQSQDAELVNTQNIMIRQKDPIWSNLGETQRMIKRPQSNIGAKQTLLRSGTQSLLIWEWHHIDGRHLYNAYYEKLLLAFAKVFGGKDDGAAIVVFSTYPVDGNPERVTPILENFIADMLPSIQASLNQTAEAAHGQ